MWWRISRDRSPPRLGQTTTHANRRDPTPRPLLTLLCGGRLFSDQNVPRNTVNFTDQAALGVHILGVGHNVSVELRYMHHSNAGLATPNPGVNTVQVRLGLGRFLGRASHR
ncbi:MAG TPA: acyloxyacyl hydrolase [Candidatus Sulfotelmatobacter sp.]